MSLDLALFAQGSALASQEVPEDVFDSPEKGDSAASLSGHESEEPVLPSVLGPAAATPGTPKRTVVGKGTGSRRATASICGGEHLWWGDRNPVLVVPGPLPVVAGTKGVGLPLCKRTGKGPAWLAQSGPWVPLPESGIGSTTRGPDRHRPGSQE